MSSSSSSTDTHTASLQSNSSHSFLEDEIIEAKEDINEEIVEVLESAEDKKETVSSSAPPHSFDQPVLVKAATKKSKKKNKVGHAFKNALSPWWLKKDGKNDKAKKLKGGEVKSLDAGGKEAAAAALDAAAKGEIAVSAEVVDPKRPARWPALNKLEKGYNEMVCLMNTVRTEMEQQGERQERLLQVMEQIPAAVQGLPEVNRQQTQMLEAVHTHMQRQTEASERQTAASEQLSSALVGLARTTERQEQTMTNISDNMALQQQTTSNILDSFTCINGNLSKLNGSTEANTNALQSLVKDTRENGAAVGELFNRNQRQMAMMSVVSWTLGILALTVAGFVAVSIGNNMQQTASTEKPAMEKVETAEPAENITPKEITPSGTAMTSVSELAD